MFNCSLLFLYPLMFVLSKYSQTHHKRCLEADCHVHHKHSQLQRTIRNCQECPVDRSKDPDSNSPMESHRDSLLGDDGWSATGATAAPTSRFVGYSISPNMTPCHRCHLLCVTGFVASLVCH